MEFTRILRLDRPTPDGRVPIHFRICWQGYKVRLSSGQKVKPADWDGKKVRGRVKFSSDINARLDVYEACIKKFFYRCENNGAVVTEAMIRAEVERIRVSELGQQPAIVAKKAEVIAAPTWTVERFFAKYVDDHRPPELADSTLEKYPSLLKHLLKFSPTVDFADFTLEFLDEFRIYLSDTANMVDNTVNLNLTRLKILLKYADFCSPKLGFTVPTDYRFLNIRSVESERFSLTHDELTRLETVELEPLFSQQRDVFLVACWTGQRYSDLKHFKAHNRIILNGDPFLQVIQKKTLRVRHKPVYVPLTDKLMAMLDRYPDGLPLYTIMHYNYLIKDIAKLAGLDRIIQKGIVRRGVLHVEHRPLYEIVSSHTARHTFGTLSIQNNMGLVAVRDVLGHMDIQSTMKYLQSDHAYNAEEMKKAWG